MSTRKITYDDIDRVKNLIERCILNYMEKEEVADVLYEHHNIEPCFTRIVWEQLEEENEDFFRYYYLRLDVKGQKLNPNEVDAVPPSKAPATEKMSTEKGKQKRTPVEEKAENIRLLTCIFFDLKCLTSFMEVELLGFRDYDYDYGSRFILLVLVKHLIEQCMGHNLKPEEVKDVLYEQQKIERSFTQFVWQELEKHNKEIFVNFDRGAALSFLERISFKLKDQMRMVKNLIEQCLLHYMSKEQVMDILYQKENIGYAFTKTVWEHLEQQNQEYFKNYYLRLAAKDQSNQEFNEPATRTALGLDINQHRIGILGLRLQVPTATTPALLSAPPATDNQQSGSS
ncbi:hypothetical protein L1987_37480 [Smallanthus sonchifolius]|uniref:Uncharacterized protein n=1 Tax=Smallanthus sonchifolius TaxID=185202 RepID=A0ACB9HIA3_9ASTR|nr:hypothetical protein L1987_37480 [Smallanthus sonchifolius]